MDRGMLAESVHRPPPDPNLPEPFERRLLFESALLDAKVLPEFALREESVRVSSSVAAVAL
jgi:hypothetical protein